MVRKVNKKSQYFKKDIIKKCYKYIKKPETFYATDIVNQRSSTKDKYWPINIYDCVANFVKLKLYTFNSIKPINRKYSYKVLTHIGETTATNRIEENIAKKLLGKVFSFGRIIDYQVPLKGSKNDKEVGKIDLLSLDDKNKKVYVLELKKPNSQETMLRCMLEAMTYSKLLDREKLFEDYSIPKNYMLCYAPLVFKGGEQEMEYNEKTETYKLMEYLKIKPFYLEEKNEIYKEA